MRATEPRTDKTAAKNSGSRDAGQSSDSQDSSTVHPRLKAGLIICASVSVEPCPLAPTSLDKRQGQGRGGSPDIDASEWAWPSFQNTEKTQEQIFVKDADYVYLFKKK